MIIGHIIGSTRVLGQGQGYIGLPVKDEVINCTVGGPETPAMTSAWFPTPVEIAAIARGEPIYLRVVGSTHPPVMLFAGEPIGAEKPDSPDPLVRFVGDLQRLELKEGDRFVITVDKPISSQHADAIRRAWAEWIGERRIEEFKLLILADGVEIGVANIPAKEPKVG